MSQPKNSEALSDLIALLYALGAHYQSAHWTAKAGCGFYSQHLLFERLYSGIGGEIDSLAEKVVDLYGDATVQACVLTRKAADWVKKWESESDLLKRSFNAEKALQQALKLICKTELPLGADNLLRTISDSHDTATYLLGRSIG